jgi:hypothetical protein
LAFLALRMSRCAVSRDSMSARQPQLLEHQRLIDPRAEWLDVEHEALSDGAERVLERRDRRIGVWTLELRHRRLGHAQSSGEAGLGEAGPQARIPDQ